MLTASRPEAQKRLSWTPATVSGRPALIAAVLAMSAPWSPIGVTQPSTTSSIRLGSRLLVAREQLVHQADDEVDRLGRVQRPVALALAARGPDPVEHQCFTSLPSSSPLVCVKAYQPTEETFVRERKFVSRIAEAMATSAPQPGRTQRHDARGAARRRDRLPRRGGLRRTTTSRVAERAGLSRGAHLHHFQTRTALVAAAMERLARRRLGELARRRARRSPTGPARTRARPRPAVGALRQPAVPGRARPVDATRAPTPTCAST